MTLTGITYQHNADDWLKSQTAFLNLIPDMLQQEIQDVLDTDIIPALPGLAPSAPPRSERRFVWSVNTEANQRARRRWFALVNSGAVQTDGRHYVRRGKPPYGLTAEIQRDENGFALAVFSQWNKASMVFGSIRFGRGQLPGHQDTGWRLIAPAIVTLLGESHIRLVNQLTARLETEYKKRGFIGRLFGR